jgi:redox-sensitive bicupin YhaK (pirin superfamily)
MHILKPHIRSVGAFDVHRILPSYPQKTIGPFIFFDHMGPAVLEPGQGLDVRPHPHIGLATVTYLFEGAILHRDSLGTVQKIVPGDVNWMTAGKGIVHSERTAPEDRVNASKVDGIQTWIALPKSHEGIAPSFVHHPAATLPQIELPGVRLRVIIGSAFGHRSPVQSYSDTFYVAAELDAGASLTLPLDVEERGIYLAEGEVSINGEPISRFHAVSLPTGAPGELRATTAARVMLFGGAPLDGDRFIWWNFVASSRELIEQAKEDWQAQRFAKIPGETEWIPLPDQ